MIRFVQDAVRVLNMPCREHTELLSRQLDGAISPGQAFGLRLHLLICAGCRRFKAQLACLHDMTRRLGSAAMDDSAEALPVDVRKRAIERVRSAESRD